MVKVIFKNIEKTESIVSIVQEKISHILGKFPELVDATATVSLEMENSPQHVGRDDFRVKLVMSHRGARPIVIEKEGENLYQTTAILADRLLEILHRAVEKRRDSKRSVQRRWSTAG